jgi:hypothetical protein
VGKARFIHNTGAGTLTQASASLAVALKANTWYRFSCTTSSMSGVTPRLAITTGIATEAIIIPPETNGAEGYKYIYFKTNASPGDFVISSTSSVAGQIYLDDLTLKECTGGDLYVGGNLNIRSGLTSGVTTVTDTYQVLVTDHTVICNKTTAFTVTLPTAAVGQKFNIKNINTGLVTVDGASTDTIDDTQTKTLSQWDSITIQCYVANKWVIL